MSFGFFECHHPFWVSRDPHLQFGGHSFLASRENDQYHSANVQLLCKAYKELVSDGVSFAKFAIGPNAPRIWLRSSENS